MIANIAPSSSNYEDTHNTLKYANRAKNIKTNVQRNVLNVEYHVSQYTDIINQLKQEIVTLKSQLGNGGGSSPQIKKELPLPIQYESIEEVSVNDIKHHKEALKKHFKEELKLKGLIN